MLRCADLQRGRCTPDAVIRPRAKQAAAKERCLRPRLCPHASFRKSGSQAGSYQESSKPPRFLGAVLRRMLQRKEVTRATSKVKTITHRIARPEGPFDLVPPIISMIAAG
jgi:hypothetical protein